MAVIDAELERRGIEDLRIAIALILQIALDAAVQRLADDAPGRVAILNRIERSAREAAELARAGLVLVANGEEAPRPLIEREER